MKTLLITFTLLFSTFAQAAYWTCEGKKLTAQFGQNSEGLILSATSVGSEVPSNLVYSKINTKDISFQGKEKSMRNVKAVSANNGKFEAALNIKDGGFYLADETGILIFDENMKCKFSDGE